MKQKNSVEVTSSQRNIRTLMNSVAHTRYYHVRLFFGLSFTGFLERSVKLTSIGVLEEVSRVPLPVIEISNLPIDRYPENYQHISYQCFLLLFV